MNLNLKKLNNRLINDFIKNMKTTIPNKTNRIFSSFVSNKRNLNFEVYLLVSTKFSTTGIIENIDRNSSIELKKRNRIKI